MPYSHDLRERVVSYVNEGGSQFEACRLYGISRKTVYRWLHRSDLRDAPRSVYRSKLDKAALHRHVRDYPDALLRERAAHFGVTPQTIWYALRALKVKKNDTLY